jgi:hypothetical protein
MARTDNRQVRPKLSTGFGRSNLRRGGSEAAVEQVNNPDQTMPPKSEPMPRSDKPGELFAAANEAKLFAFDPETAATRLKLLGGDLATSLARLERARIVTQETLQIEFSI